MNINYQKLLENINFYNPPIAIPVFFNHNNNNINSYIDSIILHNSILFEKYINIKYNLQMNENTNRDLIKRIYILENNNKNLIETINVLENNNKYLIKNNIILQNNNNALVNFNKNLINKIKY